MVVGRLVFDFARHSVEKTIRVKQFDSETRNLLVVLLNDGEPYEMPEGAIVRIECRKSDGEEILNDCTYVENLITAEITEQMTAAAGYAECAISVYEKESYIASWTFNIKVDTAVIVGDNRVQGNHKRITRSGKIKRYRRRSDYFSCYSYENGKRYYRNREPG